MLLKSKKQHFHEEKEKELREKFQRQLEIEKKKIEVEQMKNLKDFEEKERAYKDLEINRMQEEELQIEKEKKQILNKNKLDDIKFNLDKRLDNYKKAMCLKLEVEKNVNSCLKIPKILEYQASIEKRIRKLRCSGRADQCRCQYKGRAS